MNLSTTVLEILQKLKVVFLPCLSCPGLSDSSSLTGRPPDDKRLRSVDDCTFCSPHLAIDHLQSLVDVCGTAYLLNFVVPPFPLDNFIEH